MATPRPDSRFAADDVFDEYNPHPYRGGYDIELTYGRPLPPSSAICYPLSSSSGSASAPAPEGGVPALGGYSVEKERGSGNGVGGPRWSDDEFRSGQTGAYLGYSPFSAFGEGSVIRDTAVRDMLNCAADYLFGYLGTYGEKRDETCNYGNLNYAYERHNPQEPLLIQFNPGEPSWCEDGSYNDGRHGEMYPDSGWGTYELSYSKYSSEQSLSEFINAGSSWSPFSDHEDCSRHAFPQPDYSYSSERCYYGEPPFRYEEVQQTSAQEPNFSEFDEGHCHDRALDVPHGEAELTRPVKPSSGELYERPFHGQFFSTQCEGAEQEFSEKTSFLEFHEAPYHGQISSVQDVQIEHTWYQNSSSPEFHDAHVPKQSFGSRLYDQPVDLLDFIEQSWYKALNDTDSGEVIPCPQPASDCDAWNENAHQPYSYFLQLIYNNN